MLLISAEISCLTSILDRLDLIPVTAASANPTTMQQRPGGTVRSRDVTRVFVVHGHDEAGRESVARFLERLGLAAVILHEQPNRGDTLIEKLERNGDVSFAVVLLTPDDEGRARGASSPLAGRARQNVLLELGYFVGKLGRGNVCALHKEGIELPSDWDGVAWVNMDARGAWRFELARELKHAGFTVDLNEAV